MTSPTATISPSRLRIWPEHAGSGRGQLHRGFVGLQLDDVLVQRDGVAFALEPAADLHFVDRFAHFGNLQFDTHSRYSKSSRN